MPYDFSGWVTKNDIKCSDGRTIRRDAFKDNDGQIVPLVWQHQHDAPENVLGQVLLENKPKGVYGYGSFNHTESGQNAKQLVEHGDISSLSIYANRLTQSKTGDVLHGVIREVSLVLAGANRGAVIDFPVLAHSDGTYSSSDDEAIIYFGEDISLDAEKPIKHAETEEPVKEEGAKEMANENKGGEKTVKDVFDTLTEEQKTAVYFLIGEAIKGKGGSADKKDDNDDEAQHSYDGGYDDMKYNVFEGDDMRDDSTLSHAEMETIISDGKRFGSLKESFLQHAEEYGIENIDYLFPEAKTLNDRPEFIQRKNDWVAKVMSGVHHTPFSRIKSVFADITEDEARARGYMKGKLKKEEVFSLLKRTTTPTTIYKKQKMDRDDVIDITDFDVIAWLKTEMRMMLDEELARAFLFGDGRLASSDDKINETNIRPIVSDEELYTISKTVAPVQDEDIAKTVIKAAIKARKDYRGSGNPVAFMGEDLLADMLLLEDGIGHSLFKTEAELATKLRVREIIPVPDEIIPSDVYMLIVNLNDYNVGADKGGAVNMFDDFDIDYNQQKYLIETRCSGALTKPYSAIVLKHNA